MEVSDGVELLVQQWHGKLAGRIASHEAPPISCLLEHPLWRLARLGGACAEQPRQRGVGKAGGAVEAKCERRGTDAHFESLAYF